VSPLFEQAPRGRKYLAKPDEAALTGPLLDDAETIGLDLLIRAEEGRS
jgi:hypothetical protein